MVVQLLGYNCLLTLLLRMPLGKEVKTMKCMHSCFADMVLA